MIVSSGFVSSENESYLLEQDPLSGKLTSSPAQSHTPVTGNIFSTWNRESDPALLQGAPLSTVPAVSLSPGSHHPKCSPQGLQVRSQSSEKSRQNSHPRARWSGPEAPNCHSAWENCKRLLPASALPDSDPPSERPARRRPRMQGCRPEMRGGRGSSRGFSAAGAGALAGRGPCTGRRAPGPGCGR